MKMHALLLTVFFAPVTAASELPVKVPSDANADYFVLEVSGEFPNRTIVTKRVGPSATGYSKRLYDCDSKTVKYLGTGDTIQQMEASPPDPQMGPVLQGSIAHYVGLVACAKN